MKRKLELRKETIASLNKDQQSFVFGGLMWNSESQCATDCAACSNTCNCDQGGGSNGPVTSIWWTKNPPPASVAPC